MSSAPWGCIGCTDAFFVPFRFGRSHLRAVEGGDGWYLPVPLSWLRIAKSIYVIHITLVNGMMDRKQSPRDFVEKKKPMIKEDGSADCSVFDRHRFGCASLALRPFFFNRTCLAMEGPSTYSHEIGRLPGLRISTMYQIVQHRPFRSRALCGQRMEWPSSIIWTCPWHLTESASTGWHFEKAHKLEDAISSFH